MISHPFLVHTLRKRSEHEDTVNVFIVIYNLQHIKHIGLIRLDIHNIFLDMYSKTLCLFNCVFLVSDIAGIASHSQNSQSRHYIL